MFKRSKLDRIDEGRAQEGKEMGMAEFDPSVYDDERCGNRAEERKA